MKHSRIKIIIAEQSSLRRFGLRKLFAVAPDIQIIGEATNGQEAIQMVEALGPEVLIMDLEIPIIDAIRTMELIKQSQFKVPIIIISFEEDLNKNITSVIMNRGAWAFFSKEEISKNIILAVRQARSDDH